MPYHPGILAPLYLQQQASDCLVAVRDLGLPAEAMIVIVEVGVPYLSDAVLWCSRGGDIERNTRSEK